MYRTSARHEIGAAVVTFGVTALVTAYLYLNTVFPLWQLFRPPLTDDYAEGPAEARMLWFSFSVGVLCAVAVLIAARRLGLRHVVVAYVGPLALVMAGLMGMAMSVPPWYDRLWGEEVAVDALGLFVSVPQVAFGLCMLGRVPGAYPIGGAFAAFGAATNAGVLLMASTPFEAWFILALVLYSVVVLCAALHLIGSAGGNPTRPRSALTTRRLGSPTA